MSWPSDSPYGSDGWLADVIRSLRCCETGGDIEDLARALERELGDTP